MLARLTFVDTKIALGMTQVIQWCVDWAAICEVRKNHDNKFLHELNPECAWLVSDLEIYIFREF